MRILENEEKLYQLQQKHETSGMTISDDAILMGCLNTLKALTSSYKRQCVVGSVSQVCSSVLCMSIWLQFVSYYLLTD